MKVTMNSRESKRAITLETLPAAKAMITEFKQYAASDYLSILASSFGCHSTPESYTAEIRTNARAWNTYTENSERLDIWLETVIGPFWHDGAEEIVIVGAYLSDVWEISGYDNRHSEMYIRVFREQ